MLVIRQFACRVAAGGHSLCLPQEDRCLAVSVQPSRKRHNEGGPSINTDVGLLPGRDGPCNNLRNYSKSHLLLWPTGTPDGHARRLSLLLLRTADFLPCPRMVC